VTIEDHPKRLPPLEPSSPHSQLRIISQHGTNTRHNRGGPSTPTLNVEPCSLASDPLASPIGQGGTPVQTHGEFDPHPRQSVLHTLHEPNVEFSSLGFHETSFDSDTSAQERIGTLPAHLRVRVLNGKNNTGYPRFD
jgi:hypothetical protein